MSSLLQRSLFERPRVIKPLWPHQIYAINQIRTEIRCGTTSMVVVMPCGGGKTHTFSHVLNGVVSKGNHGLLIANRIELINQSVDKLIDSGIAPEHIGVIRADDPRRNPRALVQVASVDTLRNRVLPPADVVVWDEGHYAGAPVYRRICGSYSKALHLYFTATPWPAGGKGMGNYCEKLIVGATVRQLIDEGFLVQPLVYSHPERADLSGVDVTREGDYNEQQLAAAVDKSRLIGHIVKHWLRYAEGLRTLVFAVSVAHSIHIRDQFRAAGITAEHIDANTPEGERKAIIARLKSGTTLVVCNCGVLTTGFDEQQVKCVVMARPTKSRTLLYQCCGRALRVVEGRPDITSAIILDHGGCFSGPDAHPLPEQIDESDYTLEDADKRKRASVSNRTCPNCNLVCPGGMRVCVHCGEAFAAASAANDTEPKLLEESDGELVLRQQAEAVLTALRSRIQRTCMSIDRARGWSPGETNGRLLNRYRKSRSKMTALELRSVASYLESGFAADNPIEAPKAETVSETPEWLAKVAPPVREREEFEL